MAKPSSSWTDSEDIGARIRRRRKSRGLTLLQLSELSGVSRAALSKIERGEISPTYSTLRKVGLGLELTIAGLLSASPSERPLPFELVKASQSRLRGEGDKGFRLLAGAKAMARAKCFVSEVHSPSADAEDFHTHGTEDIVYVLEGRMTCHLQGHPPINLDQGDSLFYRGEIPHTFTRRDDDVEDDDPVKGSAPIGLWVSMAIGPAD